MAAEVEAGSGLSVQEAAFFAGVSERSLRKWMQDGKLPFIVTEQGKRVMREDLLTLLQERRKYLTVPHTESPEPPEPGPPGSPGHAPEVPGPTPEPSPVDPGVDLNPLAALLEKMHRENVELAGRVGFYQAELEKYKERVLLLEAPKASTTTITLTREEIPVDNHIVGVVNTEPLPWWKRLFGAS